MRFYLLARPGCSRVLVGGRNARPNENGTGEQMHRIPELGVNERFYEKKKRIFDMINGIQRF